METQDSGGKHLCAELGDGPGGQIANDCLAQGGLAVVDTRSRKVAVDTSLPAHLRSEALPFVETPRSEKSLLTTSGEPKGLFTSLLLGDTSPADEAILEHIRHHRWSFKGDTIIAETGRAFSFFVWCLLLIQQNIQTDYDGDALDPKLEQACQSFVACQCRRGRMSDMYQVLTHFICNSCIFHEWTKYIRVTFEHPKSNQESFVVPHVEQIWTRYLRLQRVMQAIFGILDERFVWRHRLPRISDLLHEHMRKRCFSSDLVTRHELFQSVIIKDETLKQVKFAFVDRGGLEKMV